MVAVRKLQFLRSRLCCRIVCSNVPNDQHSWEELFWHLAIATSKMAPVRLARPGRLFQTSKTTTAWWLAAIWEVCQWPWHVKSIMKAQENAYSIFPTTKLDRLWKLVAYNFAAFFLALENLYLRTSQTGVAVPELFLRSRLCCRNLCSNAPNDQQGLEEHGWHFAVASLTVSPVRLARPGWLFKQAKLPLHLVANLRSMPLAMTCQINDQGSRQSIFHLPQHKAGSPWKTGCCPQLRSFTFSHCKTSL